MRSVSYSWRNGRLRLPRTNAQNDALLHKLVHTQLLSGSLNPELELTGAQKKKALAGRILELTGDAKLGQGEKIVRRKEHGRAAKRVREGLDDKRVERQEKQLAEVRSRVYKGEPLFILAYLGQGYGKLPSCIEEIIRRRA